MKVIFDTRNYYEGVSLSDGHFVTGSIYELSSNDDIDKNSIQWSEFVYQDEKEYFHNLIQELIESYEKRYRTVVEAIGLVGRVGRWNGSPVGGKIIDVSYNPVEHMGRVDDVDVTIDEDGVISIQGHHHDGTHRMQVYLLTENKLRKVAPDYLRYGDYGYRDMENIYEELKPLKAGKKGLEFYGSYAG